MRRSCRRSNGQRKSDGRTGAGGHTNRPQDAASRSIRAAAARCCAQTPSRGFPGRGRRGAVAARPRAAAVRRLAYNEGANRRVLVRAGAGSRLAGVSRQVQMDHKASIGDGGQVRRCRRAGRDRPFKRVRTPLMTQSDYMGSATSPRRRNASSPRATGSPRPVAGRQWGRVRRRPGTGRCGRIQRFPPPVPGVRESSPTGRDEPPERAPGCRSPSGPAGDREGPVDCSRAGWRAVVRARPGRLDGALAADWKAPRNGAWAAVARRRTTPEPSERNAVWAGSDRAGPAPALCREAQRTSRSGNLAADLDGRRVRRQRHDRSGQ